MCFYVYTYTLFWVVTDDIIYSVEILLNFTFKNKNEQFIKKSCPDVLVYIVSLSPIGLQTGYSIIL